MHYVVAVMGLAILFLFNAYTGQVEKRVLAEVSAAEQKITNEWQRKTADASQQHIDDLDEKDAHFGGIIEGMANENNMLRQTVDGLALSDPTGFGDRLHTRLALGMCLIGLGEQGNNREAVAACYSDAREAQSPTIALTQTINADLAERYAEQCDDGNTDFCDWAITGFTPQGALTFENYWLSLADYARGLNADIDLRDAIIEMIKNPPPLEATVN